MERVTLRGAHGRFNPAQQTVSSDATGEYNRDEIDQPNRGSVGGGLIATNVMQWDQSEPNTFSPVGPGLPPAGSIVIP
jgi:hypothetical protein